MNKFTDFSDQVTFVSSQIIGRDFSGKGKSSDKKDFEFEGKTYKVTDNQYKQLTSEGADKKSLLTSWGLYKSSGSQQPGKQTQSKNSDFYENLKNATDTQVKAEKAWGVNSPEADLARKYRTAAFDRANTTLETDIFQNHINNLELEAKRDKLQKKKDIKEAGNRLNYATGNLLEKISNSKAGKKLKLDAFNNTSHSAEYKDKDGRIQTVITPRTSTLTYLADNGDKVAKAAGEVVTTAAKTAGNALYKMTGGKDSEKTTKLKESLTKSRSDKRKDIAAINSRIADLKANESSGRKISRLENKKSKISEKQKKAEKLLNNKIADQSKQDKFDHTKRVLGTVGTGIDLAKTAVSSKARENEIRKGGVEGLKQKQAHLMYLLGDRSDDVKIALGKTEGMGLGAKLKSKVFQHKINKSNRRYQESLNAQYAPQLQYVQYPSPRSTGFSEEQINALNGILSKDFSEGAEVFEGLNLSWQPEEYAKLNSILETDFETLDAQVAESQPDMSEKKVEKNVSNEQVEDSQSGEIDVSDTIDYDNLDPETLTALVDKSYYEAPDEEKRYQEMIAKGFAEKESSYNNFLESMSDFVDQSL